MSAERPVNQIYQRILAFVQLGIERGIANFSLAGPGNVPTDFRDFAALFPQEPPLETGFAIVTTTPGRDQKYYYNRILDLEVSERIRAFRIRENPALRVIMERAMLVVGLPSIVLAIGETRDTKQESILLFAIKAISPENALSELQERVHQRKTTLN